MSAPNLREVEWAISKLEQEESSKASYLLLASLYTVRQHMTSEADEAEPMAAAAPLVYSTSSAPFSRQTAEEWTAQMQNADGTTGPHWSFDQAKQVMTQRKIDCDPNQFYAVLNAVYSDFYGVAKKHGVSNIEFFADLAKAWLDDKDAVPDKASAYFESVVKH